MHSYHETYMDTHTVNICPEDGIVDLLCFREAQDYVYHKLESRYSKCPPKYHGPMHISMAHQSCIAIYMHRGHTSMELEA